MMSFTKISTILFWGFLILYTLGASLLTLCQRWLIFFPPPESQSSEVKSIWLSTQNASIKVWVIHPEQKKAIIYFGGNAEDVLANASPFSVEFPNHTTYIVNYRGYGGSSGVPSEKAFFEDSLEIFDSIQKAHMDVSVIGRSLGSGTACYLAAQRKIEKLILVTPMDSVRNVAKSQYPLFPIDLMLKHPFDSDKRVSNISAPTLILLAEHDRVIPRKNSMKLIEQFPEKQLNHKTIPGTDHNSIGGTGMYYNEMQKFLLEAS